MTLVIAALAATQAVALIVLLRRLWPGRHRPPPIPPVARARDTTVTVVVTALNEVHRIAPCLDGLRAQGDPVIEILVVDSNSTDGTRQLVEQAARLDSRVRLLTDSPVPPGWVGKVWALEHGLRAARGEWILGIDADTEPQPGMVAGAVAAAQASNYAVVSFSPRFSGQTAAEQWLQPAMLASLVYRSGAVGTESPPDRVLANGQCFLARRSTLVRHGGYASARGSFADDVTLARHIAARGERVGFLDGSRLYLVRSYRSAGEMWREWGRSIDLRDATTPARQVGDVVFLGLAQALPLPIVIALVASRPHGAEAIALSLVNAALLGCRFLLLGALAHCYERLTPPFWLSWLADPLAVLRVALSSVQGAPAWRGRRFDLEINSPPT